MHQVQAGLITKGVILQAKTGMLSVDLRQDQQTDPGRRERGEKGKREGEREREREAAVNLHKVG